MVTGNGPKSSGTLLVLGLLVAVVAVHSIDGAPDQLLASGAKSSSNAAKQREAQEQLLGSLQEARAAQSEPQQEESYQRVYEAFTRLVHSLSNNSLGNARRLVTRLNQLVGAESSSSSSTAAPVAAEPAKRQQQQQQTNEEEQKTEQILQRLDQVNKQTDQHTLRQLQDDVNRLVGSLSDSYLRNIRRVIERVNKTIGNSTPLVPPPAASAGGDQAVRHQMGDRLEQSNDGSRQPGFPGWDELIVAVDRMQKSLANFVRSSTKLITSGRR